MPTHTADKEPARDRDAARVLPPPGELGGRFPRVCFTRGVVQKRPLLLGLIEERSDGSGRERDGPHVATVLVVRADVEARAGSAQSDRETAGDVLDCIR